MGVGFGVELEHPRPTTLASTITLPVLASGPTSRPTLQL
jgi:hypothetical protein